MVRHTLAAWLLASVFAAGSALAADCKVGVSMFTLNAPYYAAQLQAAQDQAKKAGCSVSTSDGQNDMSKQIGDVEDMVSKGVNLLIINPRDPEGLVPSVNAAAKAGVKVVVIDSGLDPKANYVTLVQSSNDRNGFLVGEWIAKTMQGKPMKIALLSGAGLACCAASPKASSCNPARPGSRWWRRAGAPGTTTAASRRWRTS